MSAPRPTDTDALVFDLYGTLLDVAAVTDACAEVTADGSALATLWRAKQLEYSWLRSLMDRYVDFWAVTGDALDHAAARLGVVLPGDSRTRLLDAWLRLPAFAEVPDALVRLATSRSLAILSNGSPGMLTAALAGSGLAGRFAHVVSVDEVGTYKPSPVVYRLVAERLGLPAHRILFVSSNGWDVAGASAYGFRVAWMDRAGLPPDRLAAAPDIVVRDVADLADLIGDGGTARAL